ncbi:MAG: amino acid ABC transporter substrate-binding protein, partial [Candidatus Thioglobus sp.]
MNKLLKISAVSLITIGSFGVQAGIFHSDTLKDVQAKGSLTCGVSTGTPGFSSPDSSGNWSGIDVDVCRAVAAA